VLLSSPPCYFPSFLTFLIISSPPTTTPPPPPSSASSSACASFPSFLLALSSSAFFPFLPHPTLFSSSLHSSPLLPLFPDCDFFTLFPYFLSIRNTYIPHAVWVYTKFCTKSERFDQNFPFHFIHFGWGVGCQFHLSNVIETTK